MSTTDELLLIRRAFDAIGAETEAWDEFLAHWARFFGSHLAQLCGFSARPTPEIRFGLTYGVDPSALKKLEPYIEVDSVIPRMLAAPGKAILAGAVDRHPDLYADVLRGFDIDWSAASIVGEVNAPMGPPTSIVLALMRDDRRGAFTPEEAARFERFLPVVQRALLLHLQIGELQQRAEGAEAALDHLAIGVAIVEADATVRTANVAAHALAERRDGIAIQRLRLVAERPEDTRTLHELIARTALIGTPAALRDPAKAVPGGTAVLARSSGGRPLIATVVPVPNRDTGFGRLLSGRVLVFLADPEAQPTPPADLLRQVYRLSATEADLAIAIAEGQTLADYAERRAVTLNTARTVLQRAQHKTGCARQTDLARLVLSLGTGLRASR